jgi:hypothetical protein
MAWKWGGREGQANKMRTAISVGTRRAVWHCKGCRRGQTGNRTFLPDIERIVKVCRYCRLEQ